MRDARQELAAAWRRALADELPAAVALRRELHAVPEASGNEHWTAARVAHALEVPGDAVETVVETGRLIRIGAGGPTVGLRSELDALPVQERTGVQYASRNGLMHACGHDVHLAALVAVARAARALGPDRLPAGLLVVLQPREETAPTGASQIVDTGRLAVHDVRAMVAAHVQPRVAAGRVAIDPGPVNAGIDEFRITVTGRGGHGAYPHLAIDPVPPLCRIVLALPDAVRGMVDPMHPAVMTVPMVAGGPASNVIPDQATAAGTLRTMHDEDLALVMKRMRALVSGVASGHGCTGEVEFLPADPVLVNDPGLAAAARAHLGGLGGDLAAPFASCGSDDFANYRVVAPILMMFVGTGDEDGASTLHDPRFLPSDARVGEVARAMLAGCLAAFDRIGA